MKPPRYTDSHRFPLGYVPSKEMGEGYLRAKFDLIRQRQKEEAARRLNNVIAHRKAK